ncbi:VOC family protein, partial [Peribacillus sp. SIMBA_075]|uniref:VOC family protein n=1 Tax=Peribacillus sp. SIMBA_075 TaxID=3085813 RepID=UPI00397E5275
MQKVSTFLWFEHGVEEAAELYTSLLPDSRILHVQQFGAGMPDGLVVVRFTLGGVE